MKFLGKMKVKSVSLLQVGSFQAGNRKTLLETSVSLFQELKYICFSKSWNFFSEQSFHHFLKQVQSKSMFKPHEKTNPRMSPNLLIFGKRSGEGAS